MSNQSAYSCEALLSNDHGLHARPATLLVEKAHEFKSEIFIDANGQRVDCKSILDILSCGCPPGSKIIVSAHGPDRKEAVTALKELIEKL